MTQGGPPELTQARLRYSTILPSLRLRVGLNLGDVIVGQDGDLYGDGINIAVRLEGIADPGGILISEKVHDEVEGKLDAAFEDRGEQQLENISKPVRVYVVRASTCDGDEPGCIREWTG
jgi:class 3 adenylate cyclase